MKLRKKTEEGFSFWNTQLIRHKQNTYFAYRKDRDIAKFPKLEVAYTMNIYYN